MLSTCPVMAPCMSKNRKICNFVNFVSTFSSGFFWYQRGKLKNIA